MEMRSGSPQLKNKMQKGGKHNRNQSNASMNSAKSETDDQEYNIDEIIEELVSVQNKPPGTLVTLELAKIKYLINQTLQVV